MKRPDDKKKDKKGIFDRLNDITGFLEKFIFGFWDIIVIVALAAFMINYILKAL